MNYIFTGLNEKYWSGLGSSWIYSLREKAKYNGEIVIVDCGLSDFSRNKIKEKNVTLIKNKEKGEVRLRTIKEISSYAKKNRGSFVYWDADIFFEDNIDQVFEEISDKLIVSENKNSGFLGGPYYQWAFIGDVINFMSLTGQNNSNLVFDCLINHFTKFVKYVSNTWNFIELSQISERKIEIDGKKPKVIHPTGAIKALLKNKKFLFSEREDENYLKFIENKSSSFRKLIRKKST